MLEELCIVGAQAEIGGYIVVGELNACRHGIGGAIGNHLLILVATDDKNKRNNFQAHKEQEVAKAYYQLQQVMHSNGIDN